MRWNGHSRMLLNYAMMSKDIEGAQEGGDGD